MIADIIRDIFTNGLDVSITIRMKQPLIDETPIRQDEPITGSEIITTHETELEPEYTKVKSTIPISPTTKPNINKPRYTKPAGSKLGFLEDGDYLQFGGGGFNPIYIEKSKILRLTTLTNLQLHECLSTECDTAAVRRTLNTAIELCKSGKVPFDNSIKESVLDVGNLENRVNANAYRLAPGTNELYYRENGGAIHLKERKTQFSIQKAEYERFLKLKGDALTFAISRRYSTDQVKSGIVLRFVRAMQTKGDS